MTSAACAGAPVCRVAVFTPFPIQYQVPWFRALSAEADMEVMVYYSRLLSEVEQGDRFGLGFRWDLPLLDGYAHRVLSSSKLDFMPAFLARPVRGLRDELAAYRPDVALITGWQEISLLQALAACRRSRVPVVVRGESRPKQRHRALRAAHRALCQKFDVCLPIGADNRRFYLEAGVPEHRLVDAPYFVDNERFSSDAESARSGVLARRASWGVSIDACVALFVGKFEEKKRPLDFVDAVAHAAGAGVKINGLMVGDGALAEDCARRIKDCGAPVSMLGFHNQSEIAAVYAAADVLVLPSDERETWGLVVNEAMATGLPVIASDRVGCVPDLVLDGQTGATFRCGDIVGLAELLVLAARDRDGWRERGRAACERVRDRHSIARSVDAVREAIALLGLMPAQRSPNAH